MKKVIAKSVFGLAMLVAASTMVGQAHADAVDGKVQRCWAKLHSCYPGQKLENVFVFTPLVQSDCHDFCSLSTGNLNACDFSECVSRCEVAFELAEPPCE